MKPEVAFAVPVRRVALLGTREIRVMREPAQARRRPTVAPAGGTWAASEAEGAAQKAAAPATAVR